MQAIDSENIYALGATNIGSGSYDIHLIMVDFSLSGDKARYHSLEELKSNRWNAVLNGRFKDSGLYVMGGLIKVTPLTPSPVFYDSGARSTGYLVKYPTNPESLGDSCLSQKTIFY